MTLRTKSSKPAEFRKAVIVACDEKFVPYAMFLLDQILRLEQNREFDVCLVSHDDFRNLPQVATGQIRFIHLLDFDTVGNLPGSDVLPEAAFIRLFLPAILSEDYDRILYLDSDIFLNRPGLAQLFATDLENHPLAAVRDIQQVFSQRHRLPDFALLGLQDVAYFNSGVLLIDCKRFIETKLEQRCMEFMRERPDVVAFFHDQSALNGVLRGEWKELHPKWNWMYSIKTTNFVEMESPHIIHFIGPQKPWRWVNGEIPRKYYDAYRDYLRIHFPRAAKEMPPYQKTEKTRKRLRRYMLRSWFLYPRLRRYFDNLEKDPSQP
jgi:lipopolysaccharide biosynthesis glycosyltransferase